MIHDELYSRQFIKIPDVFYYDNPSEKLRLQIYHLIDDFVIARRLGRSPHVQVLQEARKIVLQQHGLLFLHNSKRLEDELKDYILYGEDVNIWLDAIVAVRIAFQNNFLAYSVAVAKYDVDGYKNSVNTRFREAGFGFRFVDETIIKVPNDHVFGTILRPAIELLQSDRFAVANDHFFKALEHYKRGNFHDCCTNLGKCVESVIKVVLDEKMIKYSDTDSFSVNAKKLISAKVLPPSYENYIDALQKLIISGIAPIRNMSSHGSADEIVEVPEHLAEFIINQTASLVTFLGRVNSEGESN